MTLERGVTPRPRVRGVGEPRPLARIPISLKNFRKDVIVDVFNEAGQKVLSYKLLRCWPSEYQALPALDAGTAAVAIETLKLELEGWERDDVGDRAGRAVGRRRMGVSALLAALDGAGNEVGQAVALLAASGVEHPERLALGDGDRALLGLCRTVTGHEVEVVAVCPACGELSEAQLGEGSVPAAAARVARLGCGGGLREPCYADLEGLPADPAAAVEELLARCVVGEPSRLPRPEDLELVDDSLAGPVVIACSDCGEPIAVDVDIERAVLERLERRAREVDREVHLLASSYHWSLAEIESLGERRRRTLAELAGEER